MDQFCGQLEIQHGWLTTLAYGHAGKPKLLQYDLEKLIQSRASWQRHALQ